MFKVLVTGAKGQVGTELLKLAPAGLEVIGFNSSDLDITDGEQVKKIIFSQKPSLIINAAAYTAVDRAEKDIERAFLVNETGVKNLSDTALSLNIPLFHISTDYVFDGLARHPYKETDMVGPTGVYGASKLAGELALIASGVEHIILRTSWVFGAEGNNFVKTMLRLAKERKELSVVADQHGCPTSATSIASVLWQLVKIYKDNRKLSWGIYNFSNAPASTWYDFASEIFDQAAQTGILEELPLLNAVTTSEYPTLAKRPAWSVMDCSAIENLLGRSIPGWKSELESVLRQLKV